MVLDNELDLRLATKQGGYEGCISVGWHTKGWNADKEAG